MVSNWIPGIAAEITTELKAVTIEVVMVETTTVKKATMKPTIVEAAKMKAIIIKATMTKTAAIEVATTLRRIHFFSCGDCEEGPDFFILM